jgi:hypothetical protein
LNHRAKQKEKLIPKAEGIVIALNLIKLLRNRAFNKTGFWPKLLHNNRNNLFVSLYK